MPSCAPCAPVRPRSRAHRTLGGAVASAPPPRSARPGLATRYSQPPAWPAPALAFGATETVAGRALLESVLRVHRAASVGPTHPLAPRSKDFGEALRVTSRSRCHPPYVLRPKPQHEAPGGPILSLTMITYLIKVIRNELQFRRRRDQAVLLLCPQSLSARCLRRPSQRNATIRIVFSGTECPHSSRQRIGEPLRTEAQIMGRTLVNHGYLHQ